MHKSKVIFKSITGPDDNSPENFQAMNGLKSITTLTYARSKVPLEIVIWIDGTFNNYIRFMNGFTKNLKEG